MLSLMFWILLSLIVWTYAGYPLLLMLLTVFRTRQSNRDLIEPSCTLVITAYNEESAIGEKLTNSIRLDYPREKLQILVASDCSNDRTHEIVRGFSDNGVELLILEERGGKTAAQNVAAKNARGEIIVFTDASTVLTPDAIRNFVQPFNDPRVGGVGA